MIWGITGYGINDNEKIIISCCLLGLNVHINPLSHFGWSYAELDSIIIMYNSRENEMHL